MSLLEVVVTGYSIIVAFCLARLLDGIRPSMKSCSTYWVHFVWIINKTANVLITYWVTWAYSAESLSFIQFIITLLPAIIIYLQCDALVTKTPEQVSSWRTHYYEVAKYFFGMNIALGICLMAQAYFAGSSDFPRPIYFFLCAMTLVSAIGYIANTHAWHRVIAIIALLNLCIGVPAYLSFVV